MVVLGLQIVWTKKIEVIELEEKELEDEEEVDSVTSEYLWRDNGGSDGCWR
jgi:hypothetical protein